MPGEFLRRFNRLEQRSIKQQALRLSGLRDDADKVQEVRRGAHRHREIVAVAVLFDRRHQQRKRLGTHVSQRTLVELYKHRRLAATDVPVLRAQQLKLPKFPGVEREIPFPPDGNQRLGICGDNPK